MNKQDTELLKQKLTRATQALEELDAAIDAQNWRVVGAKIYELSQALHAARELVEA